MRRENAIRAPAFETRRVTFLQNSRVLLSAQCYEIATKIL